MTPEMLSTRRLNRALLARQHLLERAELPLTRLIEDVAGLQTQYAPSGYIALWSRLAGFERPMLTRALEQREVIQATMMRSTIHMVSAADYWPLTAAIRRTRREWFERVTRREIDKLDMTAAAEALRAALADGPKRMRDLTAKLKAAGFGERAAAWSGMYVDLVRVPPSGTWQNRRADLYGLATDWLPPPEPAPTDEEGLELVLRRYLAAFGPAPVADAANWAGLPPALLKPFVAQLDLRRFTDERGTELLDLPGTPLPAEDVPAPPRFLPTWDACLLVHARRTQVLPEQFRPLVFNTRTPHSVPTFLIDGQVAGTWRHENGEILLQPFDVVPKHARQALDDEAHGLAQLHDD